ncbi:hypothetical protein [Maribacter forsetii]|uniref:hypothetical protein n=1 Tax=Maribacter forsetii TaxID=444515 RepID=UPI0005693E25|nr:hypothetical protein [Maribacter forsetii]
MVSTKNILGETSSTFLVFQALNICGTAAMVVKIPASVPIISSMNTIGFFKTYSIYKYMTSIVQNECNRVLFEKVIHKKLFFVQFVSDNF